MLDEVIRGWAAEEERSARTLHLAANENTLSPLARRALRSSLADRYFNWSVEDLIHVGEFMHRGMPGLACMQTEAVTCAAEMLNAQYVDTRPLSGMTSMLLATLIVSQPGDLVMTIPVDAGGHFLTEGMLHHAGRMQCYFECDREGRISVDRSIRQIRRLGVAACLLDASYILAPHPLAELRSAVGESVRIVYDASQVLGLVMGGQFQSPLCEGADLVTANTHKTFPGPHKGVIAVSDHELGVRARQVIDSSIVSSQHTEHTIALFVTFLEMQAFGREYAGQVVRNAQALARSIEDQGFQVRKIDGVSTRTHQVHVVCPGGMGVTWMRRLSDCEISANRDVILDGLDLIRLGVQDVTRRGMGEADMSEVGALIGACFSPCSIDGIRRRVNQLASDFRRPRFCFGMDDFGDLLE